MEHTESLRYLATREVTNVSDSSGVTVESVDGSDMGRLDGFMFDPADQTLQYYVVARLCDRSLTLGLVPFVPACLDAEHGKLRLLDRASAQPLG